VIFFKEKKEKVLTWLAVHPLINRLKVSHKVVLAYLLIAFFSLSAIFYAIGALHQQMTKSTDLVHRDVRAVALARELQGNLGSQERLERQYLILPKQETLDLMLEKYEQFPRLWDDFLPLLAAEQSEPIRAIYEKYRQAGNTFHDLIKDGKRKSTLKNQFEKTFMPTHQELYGGLSDFRNTQQEKIDQLLADLSDDSSRSFNTTFTLLLLGIFLATPVALSVILNIQYSLRHLTQATMQLAEGNYDIEINLCAHDEFAQLADEFTLMSRKLQELEASHLDANPLTHLPGNLVIQRRVEELLEGGEPFAHAFVDLDHFKAYNDRYGYQNGSDIIAEVGRIIRIIVNEDNHETNFTGHIGGDDYVFLAHPDRVEEIAKKIISEFEKMIPSHYSKEDQKTGFFVCQDRFGVERQFPLMTISIAIICTDKTQYDSAIALSHECAKMKDHLKRLPGNNYLIDRRKGKS